MLHLSIDPDRVNGWMLNLVLFGFFLVELTLVGYLVYLILGGTMSQRYNPLRFIREGDEYEDGESVELDEVQPRREPPTEVQGEPWGWTKPGAKPRGWREDGVYDGA